MNRLQRAPEVFMIGYLFYVIGCCAGGALAGRISNRFELGWPATIALSLALGPGFGWFARRSVLGLAASK